MAYLVAATAIIALTIVGVGVALWLRRPVKATQWIEPKTTEYHDPVVGCCTVSLPVIGQSQSQGFVTCQITADGHPTVFHASYVDEKEGTAGLSEAIECLRRFHALAHDIKQMKLYRNSLLQLIEMHKAVYPKDHLDADSLRATAHLTQVEVLTDDEAIFKFRSVKFMRGRPMGIHVNGSGDVTFVGVG